MSLVIDILKSKGNYQLLKYPNGFYSVDYNTPSVGYSVKFTQDYNEAWKIYARCVVGYYKNVTEI